MANYDGLTRNAWTGTWSPSGDHPIVLDTEIRGGLRHVSGDSGDQLTDISGQRLQEGMLVYVKNTYGSVTGNKFYQYSLLTGESRNTSTGEMPNAAGNWTEVTFGGAISTLGDIGNVSTSTPSTGQVLKWDGTEWAPSSDLTGSGGGGSTNVIAPVAFAFVDTTSNGSGTNISWSNWNSANNQLDFTFTTAQADANYAVVTDSDTFDDYYVGITNKTTTGFRAEFYDNSQGRTPSSFSPFTFIIYASTPTQSISGGSGIALTDLSVTQNTASGAGTLTYNNITGGFDYTPPDLSSFLTTVAFSDLTGTPTTIAGYGITDAFDGDYTNLTNAPTIPTALTDLGITDGTSGQVLSTDGSGNFSFVNQTGGGGGGATTLGALTDVSSTAPSTGQVLKWSGTEWAPSTDLTSTGGSGIALTDLSVSVASNFGQGNLTYNNSTGVFIFTPPDLSSYSTFSGNYSDLQGLPTLFSGSYTDLTNTPATSDNLELSLTGTTTLNLVNGDDNSIIDSINLNTITGGLSYNDLDDLPSLFSGNYNDLTNTPAIPSLAGYATQTYVQNFVAGLSSDNITEGSINLYYNDERVDDRVAALISAGTGISSTYNDAGNLLTLDIGQAVGTTDNVTFNDVTVSGTLTSDDITSGAISIAGDATITGNLTVQGTTTTVTSNTLDVADINITIADGAANAAAANLAGLTVDGAGATFTYTSADDRWNLNKALNVATVYGNLIGNVTGNVTGNADTATALATGRTFTIGGDTTAPAVSFDGTGNILLTTTLANSGVTAGTYGSGTEIPSLVVDAKGRITSASVVAVSSDLPIAGDSGTDTISLLTDTFTLAGGTGLTSTVTNNTVTFDLDDTAVTAGAYGSGTEIPVITIDDQGRITAANIATVSSDLPIAGDTGTDTVSLLTDTLTFTGGTGVDTSVASDTLTIGIGQAVGTDDDVEFAKITATEESHIKIVTTNSVEVTQKELVLAGQTTDATATEIFLNDGSSTVDIASGVTAKFKATIVATDGTDTVALTKTGLIQNVSGTTSLIGTVITETFAEDSGNNWDIEVTADDANDKLKVEVTGEASKTIDWTVFLEISEAKR